MLKEELQVARRALISVGIIVGIGIIVWVLLSSQRDKVGADGMSERVCRTIPNTADPVRESHTPNFESVRAAATDDSTEIGGTDESLTEEDKHEIEEEKRVEAFDNLTDKWMEPVTKGISMSDVEHFAKLFRQVPKGRRDECIHRALNLIPDENVMLLAGVLMDKEMDAEIVEDVYNDVLNRDEEIKKPILQQIFKDKSHPCWADTAWILDVTDELPEKK